MLGKGFMTSAGEAARAVTGTRCSSHLRTSLQAEHTTVPAQQNPGSPCTEQELPCRAKRAPQAFKNPRVRDQVKKNEKKFKSITAFRKCLLEMLTEPGLPARGGPKRAHQKFQSLTPEMPEMSVLPHGNNTLLPMSHLPPATAARVTSGVQCDRWAGRQLDTQSAWLAPSPAPTVMHHSTDNSSSSWVCGVFLAN